MSKKLNIEQLIDSSLREAEINPSSGAWKGVLRKLRWQKFLRFNPGRPNIYYLGGLFIVGAGLITVISPNLNDDESLVNIVEIEYAQSQVQSSQSEGLESEILQDELGSENLDHISPESQSLKSDKEVNQDNSESKMGNQKNSSDGSEDLTDNPENSAQEGLNSAKLTLVPYFTCSVQSGCAPLTVKFHNQSIHAKSFHWTFGNGKTYLDKNPTYIFEIPGDFRVTLTAIDESGQAFTHHQMIEVYPIPRAEFEIDRGFEDVNGVEALNFINYTTGAHSYTWDMLGIRREKYSWSSNEIQPTLKLSEIEKKPRNIRMVATNEFGCSDTSVQDLGSITDSFAPTLQFPNAFSPNTTGPVGGSYSPNEKRTDLFFPVFKEVPLEYKLRIYTRRGELVFETDNIYIGWDGYYLQERSAMGVYVWMAEGAWDNGQPFKLQGDVTLLWNDYR